MAVLTRDELAALRTTSDWRGLLAVLCAWGLIVAAMAVFALWPSVLTLILGIMIVGGRQLGLAVLMHDAAHGVLMRSKGLNDWTGQWLLGLPVGSDLYAYRAYHLKHHRHVQQAEDPDLSLSAPFPVTPTSLRRKILRDLTGQTFFKQRRAQIRAGLGTSDMTLAERWNLFRRKLGGFALTNLLLLAGLTAIGQAHLYVLLWLLPMATWFPLITRIRNIAEHAVVPDNDDPLRNARTTRAGLVTRLLLAPFNVNYHVEHHLYMWVPHYHLPRLHRILTDKGLAPRMEIQPSYWTVLKLATARPAAGI